MATESLSPAAPAEGFRRDIQGLRALAVVLVVCDHAGVPGCRGGFVGVDMFFVISGFVITGLLLRQPRHILWRTLADFYSRRIRRIVPAATVVLMATVVVAYLTLGHRMDPTLLGDVRWAALFAGNFRLIETGANYFVPGLSPSLVTHFWSLAVEEQFYLTYPLLFIAASWFGSERTRRLTLALVLVVGGVASLAWSVHETPLNAVVAYYSPFTRFWELALGSLVALIPARWAVPLRWPNVLLSFGAFAVIAEVVLHFSATTPFPGSLALLPCGATAVLLWTGLAQPRGGPRSWLSWGPLNFLGNISYSLYLYHFGWLVLPALLASRWTTPGARVGEVAAAGLCATASYYWLENPLRRSSRLKEDGLSVSLLLVIALSLSVGTTLVVGNLLRGALF